MQALKMHTVHIEREKAIGGFKGNPITLEGRKILKQI